jgi:hypothetical protein
MKYMMLMQFSQAQAGEVPPLDTWRPEEVAAHVDFMRRTNERLVESGEFVDAQGLAMPDQASIVRAGTNGEPVVSDGPFPETKEFLAGWWIVDCETRERAIALAAAVSAAPGPGGRPLNMPIEVRQILGAPTGDE